ncbi:MAG: hypothetical protein QOJ38_1966 [Solirubrobacterales bacterium]|jgi:hypothetical protein|nr:hypothetical protein [Solirubrobacterales bacterium]
MEHPGRWLIAWVATGFVLLFGFLTGFSIGLPILMAGIIATIFLIRRGGRRREMLGLLAGAGLVCLLVAAINSDYERCPGNVASVALTLRPGEQATADCGGFPPLPWAIAGGCLIAAGLAGSSLARHAAKRPPPGDVSAR